LAKRELFDVIPGLEQAVAAYLYLAGGQSRIQCQLKKAPEITVSASDTNVKYDHTKTKAQLGNFDIDTVSPYGPNVQTHVGGLMSGEVSISQQMRFMHETYPALNTACLYVDQINVRIHIKPVVYIAREFPKTGCMYKAIMEHEKKHVRVDRYIVNKYTNILVRALDAQLKKTNAAHGPMALSDIKSYQEKLNEVFNQTVSRYSKQMSNERRILQQQVDSLEEYERVRNQCIGKE
jgi:hypothetical protein